MKDFIIVSAYGENKQEIASRRIYNLAKIATDSGYRVTLLTCKEGSQVNIYDYQFIDKILYLPVKTVIFRTILKYFYVKLLKQTNELNENPSSLSNKRSPFKYLFSKVKLFFKVDGSYHMTSENNIKAQKIILKKAVSQLLRTEFGDNIIIFSSAHPGISHEIANNFKNKNGKKITWVADYRDPSISSDVVNNIDVNYAKKLDSMVCKNSNLITSVSQGCLDMIVESSLNKSIMNSYVLYNGFSESLLRRKEPIEDPNLGKLHLLYAGRLYPERDIEVLAKAINKNEKFILDTCGFDANEMNYYQQKYEGSYVYHGSLPMEKAQELMLKSDILVLLKTNKAKESGGMTGKFFEYVVCNKPILVLGNNDEEFNEIADKIKGVYIASYDEKDIMEKLRLIQSTPFERDMDYVRGFCWDNLFKGLEEKIRTFE